MLVYHFCIICFRILHDANNLHYCVRKILDENNLHYSIRYVNYSNLCCYVLILYVQVIGFITKRNITANTRILISERDIPTADTPL